MGPVRFEFNSYTFYFLLTCLLLFRSRDFGFSDSQDYEEAFRSALRDALVSDSLAPSYDTESSEYEEYGFGSSEVVGSSPVEGSGALSGLLGSGLDLATEGLSALTTEVVDVKTDAPGQQDPLTYFLTAVGGSIGCVLGLFVVIW